MNQVFNVYLYSPNSGIILLFLAGYCLFLLVSPRLFASLTVALPLLRPNERFETFVSFPKVSFVLVIVGFFIYFKKIRDYSFERDDKVLFGLILLVLIQTLAFYRENLATNMQLCGINFMRYLFAAILLSDRKGLKILNATLAISCFLICFEPIYYHFTEPQDSELWSYFHGGSSRLIAWGMWANANETSFLACFGVGNLLMLMSKKDKGPFVTLSSLFMILLFTLVIFLTASRAGLASLLLLFSGVLVVTKSLKIKMLIAIVFIAVISIAPLLTTKRQDKEASSSQRSELRQDGIYLFKMEPLTGYGYMRIATETGGMMLHNTYIQAFAELGIVGGMLLLYYLTSVGVLVMACVRKVRDGLLDNTVTIAFGVYISGMLYFMFGNQLLTFFFFTYALLLKTTINSYCSASVEELSVS